MSSACSPRSRIRPVNFERRKGTPRPAVPVEARACLAALVSTVRHVGARIEGLDREIAERAKRDDTARRLMTIPGIGPMIATALEALAPPAESFACGRDFAAWVGLTPLQRSTGGKARGKQDARSQWIGRMRERRHPHVVAVALANKNARIVWSVLSKGEAYHPAQGAATE